MTWIVQNLWLIPSSPVLAAGLSAFAKRRNRRFAASVAVGSMFLSLLLSLAAFAQVLHASGKGIEARQVINVPWFQVGNEWLKLGWVLDPLTAVMLVMVTFVGLLIFIYSLGYMAHDENFTRFFCFLSLFAGAMLGVVIANSLLLLFVWRSSVLTSYLLIGSWYHKPSAAAAERRRHSLPRGLAIAFCSAWFGLYSEAGTLLFYDGGTGCLEHSLCSRDSSRTLQASVWQQVYRHRLTDLLRCGWEIGPGPLHVWLPDAMEGPRPVSALIHAATMVAAGVFLVARYFR
jgi:NADH-quinone oxidoreductase subunit L